jgi:integrase/recombinase XerD
MNRRPSGFPLSRALVGYEQFKAAEGLISSTLVNCRQHLRLWLKYAGDVDIVQLQSQDLRAFLAWLWTDHKPKRVGGDERPLSSMTIRNVWVTLSSFAGGPRSSLKSRTPCATFPRLALKRPRWSPFPKMTWKGC